MMKKSHVFLLICIGLVLVLGVYGKQSLFAVSEANLSNFHQLTKTDPLFFDPHTDVSFLRSSVISLKKIDDDIIQTDRLLRKNHAELFPSEWRLWPDGFLATLPVVHEQTVLFFKDPTEDNAKKLLGEYKKTTKEYKKAIELHILAIQKVLKLNPTVQKKKILFLGAATTPEIILNDFMLIHENARELEQEINRREECLYSGQCQQRKKEISANLNEEIISFDPLPNEILGIDKNETLEGPFWATTGCFGFTSDKREYRYPFYIAVRKDKNTPGVFLKPMMTNAKYYRDYRKSSSQRLAKIEMANNISVRPHPEVSDYLCSDLRYMPELFMQYLKREKGVTDKISQTSKLSTLPYLIQQTFSYSFFTVHFPQYSKEPFDPFYLLGGRTAYSLYFGTFSDAVWRISKTPVFLIKQDFREVATRAGFSTYEDLVTEGMTKESIIKLNTLPPLDYEYMEKNFKDKIKE